MAQPKTQDVPPDPAAMIESMRAFGYSLPAAIADLVDNSVSASASLIEITFHWNGSDSWILVQDDGRGMGAEELTNAMRLGSRSPREKRDPSDLGRFGLGLKTAAFSQAATLIVASRAGGERSVRSWDLEHVTRSGSWSLLCDEVPGAVPAVSATSDLEHGTAVLLRGLDRLVGSADVEDEHAKDHFLRNVEQVERHLGVVFHRFLESGLSMTVNGNAVEAWDPFLRGHAATQQLQVETLPFEGSLVSIAPFVLPHHSRLIDSEHAGAAGIGGWNFHQGFYVYRARRLLVAGDWLGLPIQKEEHYKLARIQVDLENSMDLGWQIDVRKAKARIPRSLRDEMRRIATATRRRAAEAYRYRGKRIARSANVDRSFVWTRRVRRGQVSYRIDRKHPLIEGALREAGDARPAAERALRVVEETVPLQSVVMDAREHPNGDRAPFAEREEELSGLLRETFDIIVGHGGDPQETLNLLSRMEPFDSHPELVASLAEEVLA